MNLALKFRETCQDFAGRECLRLKTQDGWDIYYYEDVGQKALCIAQWLRQEGLRKNDKVGIILDNGPDWSIVYFGVLIAGGVAVPLDPQTLQKDLEVCLEDAQAKYVFIGSRLARSLKEHVPQERRTVVVGDSGRKGEFCEYLQILSGQGLATDDVFPEASPEDTASILYTSGTTARPKGVELTHKNIFSNFKSIEKLKLVSPSDTFISILPLFHAYSFMSTLILPLFIGARIVYPGTLKSDALIQIMQETGVTVMVGVPELFSKIHRSIVNRIRSLPFAKRVFLAALTAGGTAVRKATGINILKKLYRQAHDRMGGQLRYFVSGGARLDPYIGKDFYKFGFTILEGYGLAETSPIVTFNPFGKPKFGSVGKAIPDVEVKIDHPDSLGVGEILIKGPNVMKGYYLKPDLTADAIKGEWFHSGDLGFIDRKGYVHISGRLKEMIVLRSGKNIFPDEIEDHYASVASIREIGVFSDEKAAGPGLHAVIVPDFEEFKKVGDVNIDEKIRWEIENLSKTIVPYRRIHGYVLSKEELPRTRLGKIRRFQLSEIFLKLTQAKVREAPSDKLSKKEFSASSVLGQKILDLIKEKTSIKRPIKATDHLEIDLGMDSLTRVEVIAGLESLFGIKISDEEASQVGTVEDIEALICEKTGVEKYGEPGGEAVPLSWKDFLLDFSDQQMPEGVILRQSFLVKIASFFVKGIIWLIFKVFFCLRVYGVRNLFLEKGPYIICCNHTSYFDAFIVTAGLDYGVALKTYFVGTKDIFLHPIVRWSNNFTRVIPIDSSLKLTEAMKVSGYVLSHQKILAVFPEGQRSIDGEVRRFKKGIGILAKELDVPVLPVAIEGAYDAWPRAQKYPRFSPIKLLFGRPVFYRDILQKKRDVSGKDDYQLIAEALQEEVSSLKEQLKGM